MTDLSKLQNCLERIEEALTLPPSDEQIEKIMGAWEEGEEILKGGSNERADETE